MPLAPTGTFGGTAWFARPADNFANGPGLARTQGWIDLHDGVPRGREIRADNR
jgi:hypothetical protein